MKIPLKTQVFLSPALEHRSDIPISVSLEDHKDDERPHKIQSKTKAVNSDSLQGLVPWSTVQDDDDAFEVDRQPQGMSPNRTPMEEATTGDQNPLLIPGGETF